MFDIPHPDEHSQPANANLKIMSIHWMLVYVQRANAGCIYDTPYDSPLHLAVNELFEAR